MAVTLARLRVRCYRARVPARSPPTGQGRRFDPHDRSVPLPSPPRRVHRPAARIGLPFGARRRGPSDRMTQACAEILLNPSAARDRLTVDIFHGIGDDGVAALARSPGATS